MSSRMTERLIAQLVETRSNSARANVLEELRRLILSGGAPPGIQLSPGKIANAFQVSPIPVREALKTLVGEGLVVHQRNAGYHVSQLSIGELREIYFVRGTLEQAALAQAVSRIDAAGIERARAHHHELVTAVKYRDRKAFHEISRAFHRELTAPCAMPRLLNMFEATWDLTEPFQVMRSVDTAIQEALNDDHATMLDGFVAGDAAAVLEVAQAHHRRLESAVIETAAALYVRHDP